MFDETVIKRRSFSSRHLYVGRNPPRVAVSDVRGPNLLQLASGFRRQQTRRAPVGGFPKPSEAKPNAGGVVGRSSDGAPDAGGGIPNSGVGCRLACKRRPPPSDVVPPWRTHLQQCSARRPHARMTFPHLRTLDRCVCTGGPHVCTSDPRAGIHGTNGTMDRFVGGPIGPSGESTDVLYFRTLSSTARTGSSGGNGGRFRHGGIVICVPNPPLPTLEPITIPLSFPFRALSSLQKDARSDLRNRNGGPAMAVDFAIGVAEGTAAVWNTFPFQPSYT